jgi:acetyl esterase/lipase
MRLSSLLALGKIGAMVYARRAFGRRLEPTWDAELEIAVLFFRRQFTKGMTHSKITKGRQAFDSLLSETKDVYDVTVESCDQPKGHWIIPKKIRSNATLLYLHGGGYTFYGAVNKRFIAMVAHHCGARAFAPDYRLTPEHPHPAQAEDALAAWRYVTTFTPPENVVLVGDSAGGHMALTLLQNLKKEGLPQPALCIGLCPWTDVGERGASLYGNNRWDLIQGWMMKQFSEWLNPGGRFDRAEISPIAHNYKGLAPIYLQAGHREVMCDMISDFAQKQVEHGADVLLDVWPHMPHEFQAFDLLNPSATDALERIGLAIDAFVDKKMVFARGPNTVLEHGVFSTQPKAQVRQVEAKAN